MPTPIRISVPFLFRNLTIVCYFTTLQLIVQADYSSFILDVKRIIYYSLWTSSLFNGFLWNHTYSVLMKFYAFNMLIVSFCRSFCLLTLLLFRLNDYATTFIKVLSKIFKLPYKSLWNLTVSLYITCSLLKIGGINKMVFCQ